MTDGAEQHRWDRARYQRLAAGKGRGYDLVVRFEDGDEVALDIRRLIQVATVPGWGQLEVDPYALGVPVNGDVVEVGWLEIRALTDEKFASYLAERAEDQARQVGRRLRVLRKRRGLSARELAERAGLSAQSLSRIELGRHDVVFSTLQRLLAAMNYDLTDLATVEDLDVDPSQVRAALATTGLDHETIERVLHAVKDSAGMIARVRSIFQWSPTDLSRGAPPLLGAPAFAGRFKEHLRDRRAAATYVMYAHKIAMLADQAAERPPYEGLPDDPAEISAEVASNYGDLSFESLLRYCWDHGIVVVPMQDRGQFHGACWLIGDRPVVVLKQRLGYKARWVFDLGHEIGHVVRHLSAEEFAIVELEEIGHTREVEEKEATQFAGELLLGDADALAHTAAGAAGQAVERLKRILPRIADDAGVDVGVLANYMAYRLSVDGITDRFWATAANMQREDAGARQLAREVLEEHLDWSRLSEDDAMVLEGALR